MGRASLDPEEYIAKAREVHGDRYDYSITEYERCDRPVDIICRKHGVFTIKKAARHIYKNGKNKPPTGCQKCHQEAWTVYTRY
jgi:hypothetical protein